jgi:hypothetical protein
MRRILFALLASGILCAVVLADWFSTVASPENADPFLGGELVISIAPEDQSGPEVAYNSARDEWLVVWADTRSGNLDIYGQLVGSDGALSGDQIIIQDSLEISDAPAVAYDSALDQYLVVWQGLYAIAGRLLDAEGAPLTDVFQVATATQSLANPAVAYNPVAQEYLVVWQRYAATTENDLWGRRVSAAGVALASDYAIFTEAGDDLTPQIMAYSQAYDGESGQYLLVWSNHQSDDHRILGQRLGSAGATLGNAFVISQGEAERLTPGLALNSNNGEALVVWVDRRAAVGAIYGRWVSSAGAPGVELPISAGEAEPDGPAVAYNPLDDEFLVLWDDGEFQYGQRILANAILVNEAFAIASVAGAQGGNVLSFGTDRFLALWVDQRSADSNIFGQHLDRDGELIGYEIAISTAIASQEDPAIAYAEDAQQWLVVWKDESSDEGDIYGQFVDRAGLLAGAPIPICVEAAAQAKPDVVYNPLTDQFLVVWSDTRNGDSDIYGRRINGSDHGLLGELRLTSDDADQVFPVAAANTSSAQYLVVWEDERAGADIYGRRLNADGSFTDTFELDISTRDSYQFDPDVAYNPATNQYLVVWSDDSVAGEDETGIAGQRIAAVSPWRLSSNFNIAAAAGWRYHPTLACNPTSGECLVAWTEMLAENWSDSDIYGRRVGPAGALLDNTYLRISTASGKQDFPAILFGRNSGNYFLAWQDQRNAASTLRDLYAQAVSTKGTLVFSDADSNVPAWIFAGEQNYPVVALDPWDDRTLLVWEDHRSGLQADVYGRLAEPLGGYKLYSPLVLNSE